MKRETRLKNRSLLTILLLSFLFVISCNKKSNPKSEPGDMKENSELGDDIPKHVANNVYDKAPITSEGVPQPEPTIEDCHGKRKVTQTLEEVNGFIVKIGDSYLLETNGGTDRYKPCTLPDNLKTDGMTVRFSGNILEIFPNERLMATPFRLEFIAERDK